MKDGLVDAETLLTWVSEARRLCAERARGEIGDNQIGYVLANAPTDLDGLWPCKPVRDVLDKYKSPAMGVGFSLGKQNLRGVTSRGIFDGGQQERSLAVKYREDAGEVAATWPFTAQLLRRIADSYEREGHGHDEDTQWRDRFET